MSEKESTQLVTAEAETHSRGGDKVRNSWSISMSTLRVNIAHCRDEVQRVFPQAFLFCLKLNITRQEFAAQVTKVGRKKYGEDFNFTDNYVYKFVNGTYVNEKDARLDMSEKHFNALQTWLREKRADRAEAIENQDFIIMPTTKRIFSAVDIARESRRPVFLVGPSQIGKTCALQYKGDQDNHGLSPYIRLNAASGINGMLQCAARAVGQSPGSNKPELMRGLLGAFTPEMVPIWDEFHLLMHTYRVESFHACAEVMRELYDRVGMGMVLSVTNFGFDKMEKDRMADLQQMFRRAPRRVQLPPGPTLADVRMMCEHFALELPAVGTTVKVKGIIEKPYEIFRQLAKEEGLTAIVERLRCGRKLAQKEGCDIEWQHVVHAHLVIKSDATAPGPGWEGWE